MKSITNLFFPCHFNQLPITLWSWLTPCFWNVWIHFNKWLIENCREQFKASYATVVDLTKVFDTVGRKGLWQILNWNVYPQKCLTMNFQLHKDQQGNTRLRREHWRHFPSTTALNMDLSRHQFFSIESSAWSSSRQPHTTTTKWAFTSVTVIQPFSTFSAFRLTSKSENN